MATPTVEGSGTGSDTNQATTESFSYTCSSSSQRLLLLGVMLEFDSNQESVSSATYNSVAMTLARREERTDGGRHWSCEVWYLVAPATGSNTLSFTANDGGGHTTTNCSWAAICVDLSGVDQTTPVSAIGDANGSSTSPSVTFTTSNNNSMVVAFNAGGGGDTDPYTPGSGITELEDFASGTQAFNDVSAWAGHKAVATAGSTTMDATMASGDDWCIIAVECNEHTASASITPHMHFYKQLRS